MDGPVLVEETSPDLSAVRVLSAQVRALAGAAEAADGVAPLSEPVLLALREGDGRHVAARRGSAGCCWTRWSGPGSARCGRTAAARPRWPSPTPAATPPYAPCGSCAA